MGVPALFRFLSRKYPKIITQVIEDNVETGPDGNALPIDCTRANSLGEEIDNLYLDMNGIVHPCSHPEDGKAPKTEDDMMMKIFEYTDRIMSMVRPRKLLYIAVDGVAPRAKMNQQRSRRFRAALDASNRREDVYKMISTLRAEGEDISDNVAQRQVWDSNAITPGTLFMDILAASLRFYVSYKLNTDPAWRDLYIIISDASVPGEGEHKIMNFIRSQRSDPAHDPNTRHALYGLDADLIMLGLATHEPHFRILREDVFFSDGKKKETLKDSVIRMSKEEENDLSLEDDDESSSIDKISFKKPFIWLNIAVLREYLAVELYVSNLNFCWDFERAIDDYVFFIFFVGNDFLPHLPSLDIRENAIDTLTNIWRRSLAKARGFITANGKVNLLRVQLIMQHLGNKEEYIFKKRKEREDRRLANQNIKSESTKKESELINSGTKSVNFGTEPINTGTESSIKTTAITNAQIPWGNPIVEANSARKKMRLPIPDDLQAVSDRKSNAQIGSINRNILVNRASNRLGISKPSIDMANKSAAAAIREQLKTSKRKFDQVEESDAKNQSLAAKNQELKVFDQNFNSSAQSVSDDFQDDIKLHEAGYRERYYQKKFNCSADDPLVKQIVRSYVEGVCWVMLYYYQGCPSWTWFYPYHYAPFAQDFVDISQFEIEFDIGKPFKPFEQLLGVLPAASKEFLPGPLQKLMTDQKSEIKDFYPENFEIDMNGAKFAWQGVTLLPFIDQSRLISAAEKAYTSLTQDELERNLKGREILYISNNHPLGDALTRQLYHKRVQDEKQIALESCVDLEKLGSQSLFGTVKKDEKCIPHSSLNFHLNPSHLPLENIEQDVTISFVYEMPKKIEIHRSILLKGLLLPSPKLSAADIQELTNRFLSRPIASHNNHNSFSNRFYDQSNRSYNGSTHLVNSQAGYERANDYNYQSCESQSKFRDGFMYAQAQQYSNSQHYGQYYYPQYDNGQHYLAYNSRPNNYYQSTHYHHQSGYFYPARPQYQYHPTDAAAQGSLMYSQSTLDAYQTNPRNDINNKY